MGASSLKVSKSFSSDVFFASEDSVVYHFRDKGETYAL